MAINTDSTFPALNTTEAEEIVTELGRALDSHAEWTDKFRTMLVCRSKPKPTDLRDDSHKRTVFGKWYIAQANPNIRDHPGFAAVGENSERMHALARELAGCVRDGTDIKPAQYRAFVKSDDKFRKSLRKLLSEAWDFLRYTDPLTGVMSTAT